MKKKILLLSTFFLIISFGFSQEHFYPANAQWPISDPDVGGTGIEPVTEGYINASAITFNGLEYTNYGGPEKSLKIRIEGNAWPANQTTRIEDAYLEVAVSPNKNSNFYIDSLSFSACILSINAMKVEVYYSTDPSFSNATMAEFSTGNSNNYLNRDVLTRFNILLNSEKINDGDTLYVRFYPWVEDPTIRTGKYICLRDIGIFGHVESIATLSTVEWFINGNAEPAISGNLLSGTTVISDSLNLLTTTKAIKSDTGEESMVCALINKVSDRWIAETAPNNDLFIEVSAGPKTGGTLYADSLVFFAGGDNTSDLKLSLLYSINSDFSDNTTLISNISLPENRVTKIVVSLDIVLNTGQNIYLRFMPYSSSAISLNKNLAIASVQLYGRLKGITYDPPTVTTTDYSYLSTTHVLTGGNVTLDGGSIVTQKGVVWNTTGNPTIEDNKTIDGSGSGTFVSHVTGLAPATTYFLRAYAINDAGISYGNEINFTTLNEILPPSVTTENITDILVSTANGLGKVTAWGGDTVKIRGFCWNKTGNPMINDSHVESGQGLGSFNTTLYPLEANTTYYVRAFAINSAGEG
ncbi:hypothetical protein [Thermophagus xiamenensis]|uniref:Pectinesterase n=1 Tax=Thermophagus xiamenensis TaxID=385682 RepID=A0A1I2DS82_9BACT|nr:hypothetical protein [Thermophagus xiamenensis]SFE83347.1 pectinesterase [Thermophagus xiamenensis]